ncbi:MAG TPA: hypothetical protein VKA21_09310 [Candidatus Binatia bacterium]|nr:hypothetical protein [Candidatus Binatia bacterium]
MRKIVRQTVALVVVLSLAAPAAARRCPEDATTATFAAPGEFPVGERTLMLVDASRETPAHGTAAALPSRTLTTEIWYPGASEGKDVALASGGPFPIVLNSPGLLDNRMGEAYYARTLASRGFVVTSTDFPLTNSATLATGPFLGDVHNQPGDVRFVLDQVLALSRDPNGWLARGVDRRRIGATGLSLGAVTTLIVGYHPTLRDKRIRALLPIAPGGACAINRRFFSTSRPRLLTIVGEQDLILPPDANALPAIDLVRSPRTLVTLIAGTHTAFAGFITADRATSYDAIGCLLLDDIGTWGDPVEGLGGPESGIETHDQTCLRICKDPLPPNPPMQAKRQQELTRAIEAAFFESTLAGSRAARCFLRSRLAAENADVRVVSATGRKRPAAVRY